MARVVIDNLREYDKVGFLVHGAFCGALTRRELDAFGALALHLGGRLLCWRAARELFTLMDDKEYEAGLMENVRKLLAEASDDLAEIRAKEGR